MRRLGWQTVLILGFASAASAQAFHAGQVAFTYDWVHTNAAPGGCGCFSLNGGAIMSSWDMTQHWALVAGFSDEYSGDAFSTGKPLTLTSYLGGASYHLRPTWKGPHTPAPFARVLLGSARASGWVTGSGSASFAFAARVGGGVDIPLTPHIAVRALEADYYVTQFPNLVNDHQNNLLFGAGVVFGWGARTR
jgi:outer membrane immunogenic protein